MVYKFFILTLIISISVLFFTVVKSQETVAASGGEAVGAGASASFTVGQTFYQSHVDTSGIVSEGVQHAYEVFVVTDIGTQQAAAIKINVFPNPTSGRVVLKVDDGFFEDLNFKLIDSKGEIINQGKIRETETIIQLGSRPEGIYLLSVRKGGIEQKVFKIIKN